MPLHFYESYDIILHTEALQIIYKDEKLKGPLN